MISIVVWKWHDPSPMIGGGRLYTSEHVNAFLPMLRRHMVGPYRLICITDDSSGLDGRIEAYPMPCEDLESLDGPTRFPSCTRKNWMFSSEAKDLGARVLCLDVDTVIVSSMAPVVNRDEPLIVLDGGSGTIGGGAFLLETGTHTGVWNLRFSAQEMKDRNIPRTDQGWMSYVLPSTTPRFGNEVCIASPRESLSPDTSIALIATVQKPWMKEALEYYPWVVDHHPLAYKEAACPST